MKSETSAPADGDLKAVDIGEEFQQLISVITELAGLASSVHAIAAALPVTPIMEEDTLCPDLVFPALGKEMVQKTDQCLTLIESLEDRLPKALRSA